jgi:hypothetical protein
MKNAPLSLARRALGLGLIAAGLLPWAAAQAQGSYPSRPVRMIVGFPARARTSWPACWRRSCRRTGAASA